MKKFRIHATMTTFLYTEIEADSLEDAQQKAEDVASNGGMNEDNGGGDFYWSSEYDCEVKE